jgi:hypothetical protein
MICEDPSIRGLLLGLIPLLFPDLEIWHTPQLSFHNFGIFDYSIPIFCAFALGYLIDMKVIDILGIASWHMQLD